MGLFFKKSVEKNYIVYRQRIGGVPQILFFVGLGCVYISTKHAIGFPTLFLLGIAILALLVLDTIPISLREIGARYSGKEVIHKGFGWWKPEFWINVS